MPRAAEGREFGFKRTHFRSLDELAMREYARDRLVDGAAEPVVAYIRDASSGVISLFVGDREVTLHDTGIAAKLASAANKEA